MIRVTKAFDHTRQRVLFVCVYACVFVCVCALRWLPVGVDSSSSVFCAHMCSVYVFCVCVMSGAHMMCSVCVFCVCVYLLNCT